MKETILIRGERHTITQCGSCGVWHTVPTIVFDSHFNEGGFHHCPNGHSRGWSKGQEEKDREAIRRERDRLKQDEARLIGEIAAEKERAAVLEQKLLKAKRRAHAGVCQCCNRTFLNMQRHMKSKHPNVVPIKSVQVAS